MSNLIENGTNPSRVDRFIERTEKATTVHAVAEKARKTSLLLMAGALILGSAELGAFSITAFLASGGAEAVTTPGVFRSSSKKQENNS